MQVPARILLIGAADTGRAPMAAALLQRMLPADLSDLSVESAGVVGHDGDPAEPEARDAMAVLGIDLSDHVARSLSPDLAAEAALLLAVDSGVLRVLQARQYALPMVTLGGLAGKQRDIPDPFRMQVGAWLTYAREIESLLRAGMPQLRALLRPAPAPTEAAPEEAAPEEAAPEEAAAAPPAPSAPAPALPALGDNDALERALRLVELIDDFPGAVDWLGAREQLRAALTTIAMRESADLVRPYSAMLQAMLGLSAAAPTPAQIACLRGALLRLRAPIGQAELDSLGGELQTYAALR